MYALLASTFKTQSRFKCVFYRRWMNRRRKGIRAYCDRFPAGSACNLIPAHMILLTLPKLCCSATHTECLFGFPLRTFSAIDCGCWYVLISIIFFFVFLGAHKCFILNCYTSCMDKVIREWREYTALEENTWLVSTPQSSLQLPSRLFHKLRFLLRDVWNNWIVSEITEKI